MVEAIAGAGSAPDAGAGPAAGQGSPAGASAGAPGAAGGAQGSGAPAGEGTDKGGAAGAAGDGAGAPGDAQKAAADAKKGADAAVKKMLKAIIDGKEMEVAEEDAIRALQKEKASDKRFQEAANIRKQAANMIEMLKRAKDDPRALAKLMSHPAIGGDLKAIAEKYLYDMIQEEQLTPEQRELKEAKERLAQIEEEKRLAAEQETQKQQTELEQKYTRQYQADIISALETSGLPKTEYTVARMARYMHMGLQRGVELKASDVVEYVWKDYQRDLGAFRSLPVEKLIDMLGPEIADKIREHDLARVRAGAGGEQKPPTTPTPAARTDRRPLSTDEFRRRAAERASA